MGAAVGKIQGASVYLNFTDVIKSSVDLDQLAVIECFVQTVIVIKGVSRGTREERVCMTAGQVKSCIVVDHRAVGQDQLPSRVFNINRTGDIPGFPV